MSINDVDLTGQVVAEIGYCNWLGTVCRKKTAPEHARDHILVRLEDKKFARAKKIPFLDFTVPVHMKSTFLVDPDDYRKSLTV